MPSPTLYLDEDVNPMLADILNQRGFFVQTTKGCSMRGRSDEAQLNFAIQKGCVFFTHNISDFNRLAKEYGKKGKDHTGIILAPQWELSLLLRATLRFFQEWAGKSLKNQIVWLHSYLKS